MDKPSSRHANRLRKAEVSCSSAYLARRLLYQIDWAARLFVTRAIADRSPAMSLAVVKAVDALHPSGEFSYGHLLLAHEARLRSEWRRAAKSGSAQALRNLLRWIGSFARLPILLAARGRFPDAVWWKVFGEEWPGTEGARELAYKVRNILRRADASALAMMMTAGERKELSAMPARFTVWRGCYEINNRGVSWTLDRAVAESFPLLHRYRGEGEGLLLCGMVAREDAVLLRSRNEAEILTGKVVGIRRILL